MVRRSLLVLCVATAAVVAANPVLAGKPPGKPGSRSAGSIALAPVDSTDGLTHYGQTVRFDVSTTATDQPWVNLQCFQNGELVAEGWNGYFSDSITGRDFGLYSPKWTGGAAECTAWLVDYAGGRWKQLASTSFHVDA